MIFRAKPDYAEVVEDRNIEALVAALVDAAVAPLEAEITALRALISSSSASLPGVIDNQLPRWVVASRDFPMTLEALGREVAKRQRDFMAFGSLDGSAPRWWVKRQPNLTAAQSRQQIESAVTNLRAELEDSAHLDCFPAEGDRRTAFLQRCRTSQDMDIILKAASEDVEAPL